MKTKKHKNKNMRFLFIAIGIIVFLAALAGIALLATAPGRAEVAGLTFSDIDFARLHDGTYVGEYYGEKDSSRDTMVEITISAGKLVKINAVGGSLADGKQTNEISGGKSLDDLFNSVMESQTLNVDAISGATLTSKSYLKAVEDALSKAQS
jgi:uncharacterized protein with FMN-binding domain